MSYSIFDQDDDEGLLRRLRFTAQRNAVYHAGRRSFFDFWERFINFTIVLSGSAAFASFTQVVGMDTRYAAAFSAVTVASGLFSLVFALSQKAGTHAAFQKEYFMIVAEIAEMENTAENRKRVDARMQQLYAQEPPTYHALNYIAYNNVLMSMGGDPYEQYALSWPQRAFANISRFETVVVPSLGEVAGRKSRELSAE